MVVLFYKLLAFHLQHNELLKNHADPFLLILWLVKQHLQQIFQIHQYGQVYQIALKHHYEKLIHMMVYNQLLHNKMRVL